MTDAILVEALSETDDDAMYSVPFEPLPGTDGEVGGGQPVISVVLWAGRVGGLWSRGPSC